MQLCLSATLHQLGMVAHTCTHSLQQSQTQEEEEEAGRQVGEFKNILSYIAILRITWSTGTQSLTDTKETEEVGSARSDDFIVTGNKGRCRVQGNYCLLLAQIE